MTKKEKIKYIIKILVIGIIIYYFIPAFGYGINTDLANIYAKICVLLINSIYAILSGIFVTYKCGFKWYFPALIIILYIPSALFYYNNDTVIYSVLYIIMYIIGTLIQMNIRKK